ncbi:unnamed protein product [Meganyctiphanes norvegica]|uniref:TFIIS N-terminal domain-containing protein n=1 Tax=Meganyctiphanes norvegica TaxID=48144 RepID=A0AAV2SC45_MEGNR
MESADEGSKSSPVVNSGSDNESVASNVSRTSFASRRSRSSRGSRRSRKSSGSSRGSPSGDEAEERRSVLDSDEEKDAEKKKITEEAFGASDGSRSRSRSKSGSRVGSRSRSRSRSKSGSRAASGSRSRSRSKSGSRSRSRGKSGSRSGSGSRSRSRSKSGSRSRSKSGSRSRSRSRSKSGSRSKSPNKSVSRSRSRSKSGSPANSRKSGKSGSRSRSRSKSGSRSRSRSKSGSRSRSRSKSGSRSRSRSRSKSGSRSRSRGKSGSRSRSRSRSRSGSKPRSRSRSGSGSASDVVRKKSRNVMSDSDSSGSDIGRKKKVKRKRKSAGSGSGTASDSDGPDAESKNRIKKKKKKGVISGSESGSGSEKGIGSGSDAKAQSNVPAKSDSDDEGPKPNQESQPLPQLSDSEDEALRQQIRENPDQQDENHVNDFDAMMAIKKSERGYNRKKQGVDIINDNEENIALFVRRMRNAAEDDRQLNMRRKPATKKMSMLTTTIQQIGKVELIEGFLEANVLSALTDWMAPMPDRQLPTPRIRECILNWLLNLPPLSQDMLKQSGIGKAVMYLYKHPKELKINKERCGRLINMWSRPIFNNSDDFTSLSKEERLSRDMQLQANGGVSRIREKDTPSGLDENGKPLRPGDKGWCMRARVPMPSGKEYVKRPKWNSDIDMSKVTKKGMSRIDKQMRNFQEQKRLHGKARRAVSMSIEGRAMPL